MPKKDGMPVKLGHASYFSSVAQNDVCYRNWSPQATSTKKWTYMVRAKDPALGVKMAEIMTQIVDNAYIRYSQGSRWTLRTALRNNGWDPTKIKSTVYTDCSAVCLTCVAAAQYHLDGAVRHMLEGSTANLKTVLPNTGEFELYTEENYLTTDDYLRPGDILVGRSDGSGHAAMVLEYGQHAEEFPNQIPTLTVNGIFNNTMIVAMEEFFELESTGKIINQPLIQKKFIPNNLFPACDFIMGNTMGGSPVIKEIQRFICDTMDGILDRQTVLVLQRFLMAKNLTYGRTDGYLDSETIKGIQEYINLLIKEKNKELKALWEAEQAALAEEVD